MAFNRDLSQLANFLEINSDGTFVNIIPSQSEAQLGIGTNNPTAKLDVLGNARVSGNLSATNINASGIVTATSGFVGALTGLASSATQLATGRTIAITGDLTYTSGSFNGTGNVTGTGTLANTAVTPGSYGSSTEVATFTVDSKGRLTAAGTASVGTALTVAGDSGSENISLLSEVLTISGGTNLNSSAASNTVTVNLDPNISLTSVNASGIITATSGFSGNVTGNLTGDINSSGVSTVTSLNATNINTSGIVTATQFVTGASGSAIGINTNTISGPATITIDPAAVGNNTGLVVIKGDLQIDGTTTTINSTTVTVDDKNIQIADGAANDAAADGAGITITSGDGNKTFQFQDSGDNLGSSENLNVASGKVYKINNTEVLSSTTLGSGVVNSSLTSVGTLTNLSVGNVNSSGIITATTFVGALTGNVTGNLNSSGVSTVTSLNATNINASGIVTATSGFVGNLTGTASTTTNIPNLTGDITSVNTATTLATVNSNVGSFGSQTLIPVVTVNAKGLVTAVTTAAVGTALTVAGDSGSENIDLLTESLTISGGTNLTSSAASNSVTVNLDPNISLTSVVASGVITATSGFSGNVTGNLTGEVNSPSFDTNASGVVVTGIATATTFVGALTGNVTGNLTGDINSSGVSTVTSLNATNINASGIVTAAQFVTGASGSAIGINTNTISGPATITIDPAAVGDNTGLVVIKGDLQIDGTTTTVNSTTVTIDDKNIVLGSGAVNDAAADGGGITLESGDSNKTFNWVDATDSWTSSEHINALTGKVYKINGTEVLSSTTLGSGVVNSSLTSVGTLTNLSVGNVNSTGIVTATSGFVGNITGNINSSGVSTVTNLNIGGYVSIGNTIGVANQIIASTGVGVTWKNFNDLLPQTRTTQTFTATASQTLFSFVYNVNFLDVFVNGVKLSSGEFTASNGSTITLSEAAFANDTVEFVSYSTLGAGTGQVSSLNDLTDVTLSGIATGNLLAYNGSEFVNTSNINVTGIVTATSGFVGNLTGLASSATQLETGRTVAITGDLAYTSGSFNGTGNVTGTGTLATVNSNVGSFGSQTLIPVVTVNAKGLVTAVTTAAVGTALTVSGDSGSENISLLSETLTISGGTNLTSSAASNSVTVNLDPNISLTSVNASGIVTAAQFVTGASGSAIGINTNTISGPATITIDPAAVGDNTGLVVIAGNLQVDGTTTTINSTTMTVDDINITLASGAASSAAANGAGITIDGASATLLYASTGDKWVFNKDVEAGNFNSTSDINLKENIRQVESASELVSKLEGVHFSWKETGKETIGVIAQQIEEHLPQLVQTGDTHKTVNYNGLIGVLIEAVKEQGAQIAALQAEIEELKK